MKLLLKICLLLFMATTFHIATASAGGSVVNGQQPNAAINVKVCECCKPNIAVNGSKLAISFRNRLNGSRDIYHTSSTDKGKTFTVPQKLGQGTWKLQGCPMDGGGLAVNERGIVSECGSGKGMYFIPGKTSRNKD